MKKNLLFLFILSLLAVVSCQKSETSQPENTATLNFISLEATTSTMAINDINSITANASGEGLTYKWTASYGTIIGSGSSVKWTVCHADTFKITCEVTDKYDHSASKEIDIKVSE